MSRSRLVLSIGLMLLGLVWIGQGVGLIGGGAMSGTPIWAVIGAALVLAAVAIMLTGRRTAASS